MSLPWSSKAIKAAPINADELLIIDSEDSNPSTQNKRIIIGNIPSKEFFGPWTATHDAGNQILDNVGQINMNDATEIRWGNTNRAILNTTAGFFIKVQTGDEIKFQVSASDIFTFNSTNLLFNLGQNIEGVGFIQFAQSGSSTIAGIATALGIKVDLVTGDIFRIDIDGTPEYTFDATQADFGQNTITNLLSLGLKDGTGDTVTFVPNFGQTGNFDIQIPNLDDNAEIIFDNQVQTMSDKTLPFPILQGTVLHTQNNATQTYKFDPNHTTPANGQVIADIQFFDDDSVGGSIQYAGIEVLNSDPTTGSADGELRLQVRQAGTLTDLILIDGGAPVPIQFFDDVDITNSTIPLLSTHFTPQGQDDIDIAKIEFFGQDSDSSPSTVNFGNIVINSIIADSSDEFGQLTFELMSGGSLVNAVVIDMDAGDMTLTDLALNMGTNGISNCNEVVFVGTNTHIVADTNTTLQLVCNTITDDIVMRYSVIDRHVFSELSANMQGDLQLKTDNTTSILKMEANHTTPAANQIIGDIQFFDDDSVNGRVEYARISGVLENPATGNVDGGISLKAKNNGTLNEYIRIDGDANDILLPEGFLKIGDPTTGNPGFLQLQWDGESTGGVGGTLVIQDAIGGEIIIESVDQTSTSSITLLIPLMESDNEFVVTDQSQTLLAKTLDTLTMVDATDIILGTTTGTKIGTATTQKIGFWNVTPIVQPIHIADATDAASAISQLNLLLAQFAALGLQAST